jgi:hypothetical protein
VSVYFIGARDLDFVKIGYASNPVRRWRHLQTFCPVELTLEGAIPGGFGKERELHRKFALARTRGEWFRLTPGIQAEIDASTKPDKFTWGAVRLWLKTLAAADEALEQQTVSLEAVARFEERLQSELVESAKRRLLPELKRREAAGDIHFPFRAKELA